MIGVDAIVSRRSMNDRTAVGRRSLSRTLLTLKPVRYIVSESEKNAIAAVISNRGSAKRRTLPTKPGRCHAGIDPGRIGATLPPVEISP
jgi:hypothetical protein